MAKLRKKKENYYAVFYDRSRQPKRKWVPLRTKDRTVARHRLTRLEKKEAMELFDPWRDTVRREGTTLKEVASSYLDQRSERSEKTLRSDRSLLRTFRKELPHKVQIAQVRADDIRAFLARDLSPSTRRTYYNRLNRFFGWALEEGYIKTSPLENVRTPRLGKQTPLFLSRAQYEALIAEIERDAEEKNAREGQIVWLIDVIKVAVGTGLRLSELCHLRWQDLDLEHGFINVRNRGTFRTKSRDERSVPITGTAKEVLQRRANSTVGELTGYVFTGTASRENAREHLNSEYVSKRFKHYVRKADEVPNEISFHGLRHTYASWLAMAGTDLVRIKELLGHADISTTMRYAHLVPQNLREPVENVFGT